MVQVLGQALAKEYGEGYVFAPTFRRDLDAYCASICWQAVREKVDRFGFWDFPMRVLSGRRFGLPPVGIAVSWVTFPAPTGCSWASSGFPGHIQ